MGLFKKIFCQKTRYISEADRFLMRFDQEHPQLSSSQHREILKHHRIFEKKLSERIKTNT